MRLRRPPQAHGTVPTVNLASPWLFEALAVRRLRLRFVTAGVALLLLVGAGWTVQHLRVTDARGQLAAEEAETTRLTAESQRLAPVKLFVAAVEKQTRTVQETMATEIYFSRILTGLEQTTPAGADLATISVSLAPPPAAPVTPSPGAEDPVDGADDEGADSGADSDAAEVTPAATVVATPSPCPGPDPFNTRVVVGCVILSGTADSRATVGDLVIRLGDDPRFVEPFISTTTTAESDEVSFTGSVGLSEKVFSGRYAEIDELLAGGAR
jgi:hypothetical protein